MSRSTAQIKPSRRGLDGWRRAGQPAPLLKAPTGITGLDEITGGGLPRGRTTLVCGGPGCGKTLLALEFLLRGALTYDEPGVFVAFEETEGELIQNTAGLGFDLPDLIARKKLLVDYVQVERSEIEETGEYDLEGLFIRLGQAIDAVGARRVVLDTVEVLFSGLANYAILRSELRRLFRWLKDRGVTVIVTGERGDGSLTRHGLEEYVSDCVILLDHRVHEEITTRRLRVVKYRGSAHGTNEYPFLIDEHGVSVLPVTSLALQHAASDERVSSGIPALDAMLGGQGYYRGASILVSGTAGAGKSSIAAHFVAAAATRGERCLYFAFEESAGQIERNMRSIGLDLEPPVRSGRLRFHAVRPTYHGLEMHLVMMHRVVDRFDPRVVVVDPITNLVTAGTRHEVRSTLTRLIDFLKLRGITALFTSLTTDGEPLEHTDVRVSSLIDTWLVLRDIEIGGERNRGLYLLKSRGMAHSNQLREFRLTDHGVELIEVYRGLGGVVTGSARLAQEAQEQAAAVRRRQEFESQQRILELKRRKLEAQIAALRADLEAETEETQRRLMEEMHREQAQTETAADLARLRWAGPEAPREAVVRNDGPAGPRKGKR